MKKFFTTVLLVISSYTLVNAAITLNSGSITFGGTNISISSNNIGNGLGGSPLMKLLGTAQLLVSRLVPFMVGLAVVVFFWYLIQFIWKANEDPGKREEGLKGMGYSLLAIFVMVSVWGIIAMASSVLGVSVGGGLPPLKMPGTK